MTAFGDVISNERSKPVAPADVAVWALLGNRHGDNRMIETLAAASGLSWRAMRLRFNFAGGLPNARRRGSLFTLTRETRAWLAPPWPDVAITSGTRAVPAALWVRAASGGRTRLVHLGRPQAPLSWFDLVITTPQYGLPARANVVVCRFPPTALSAPEPIRPDLAALPRPRLVAIVGGSAAPLVLDALAARTLASEALARTRAAGGSLLVATSPRTARPAVDALRAALSAADVPVRLSVFGEGVNDYRAYLAAADACLVTDDTALMATEAAMTGAPVSLFRLPNRPNPWLRWVAFAQAASARCTATRRLFEAMVSAGLVRSNRDLGRFMGDLEADGLLAGGSEARDLATAELRDAAARLNRLLFS